MVVKTRIIKLRVVDSMKDITIEKDLDDLDAQKLRDTGYIVEDK